MVGLTAWQALFDDAGLTAGQRVLINGAGGAVGGYAVQLAKQAGAHVIATASPRSSQRVGSAGADEVIDHTTTEVTVAEPVDVLLNLARITPEELVALVALVRPGGVVVNTVPTIPTPGDDERGVRAVGVFVRSDAEQLSHLVAMVDRGELRVDVAERVPLAELPAVHAKAAAGDAARQGRRPPCRGPLRFPGAPTSEAAAPLHHGPDVHVRHGRPGAGEVRKPREERLPLAGGVHPQAPHPSRPAPRPREVQRVHDAEGGGRRSTMSTQSDGRPRPRIPAGRGADLPVRPRDRRHTGEATQRAGVRAAVDERERVEDGPCRSIAATDTESDLRMGARRRRGRECDGGQERCDQHGASLRNRTRALEKRRGPGSSPAGRRAGRRRTAS